MKEFHVGKKIEVIFGLRKPIGCKRKLFKLDKYNEVFIDGWTLRIGSMLIDYSPSAFGKVGHNTSEVVFKPWWKKW